MLKTQYIWNKRFCWNSATRSLQKPHELTLFQAECIHERGMKDRHECF